MASDRQPSVTRTAFECPHCGAFTTQYWYCLYVEIIDENDKKPTIIRENEVNDLLDGMDEKVTPKKIRQFLEQSASGQVFLSDEGTCYSKFQAQNLHISECYECKKFSVWVHERLIYPPTRTGAAPNQDLPDNILADYEEARSISELSPRGSAALLRLCVQNLCRHILGEESGKTLNADIGKLVKKGLNPLVRKSLDAVRVIGNNAVHPGVLDLKDDHETAMKLFDLVNVITNQMITQPNAIGQIYEDLVPDEAKEQIEHRDN